MCKGCGCEDGFFYKMRDWQERLDLIEKNNQLQSLVNRIINCANCGGTWYDDGINSGCSCKYTKELRELKEKIKDLELNYNFTFNMEVQKSKAILKNIETINGLVTQNKQLKEVLNWVLSELTYEKLDGLPRNIKPSLVDFGNEIKRRLERRE